MADRWRPEITGEVTLGIEGYPAYERALSGHHPAYWSVALIRRTSDGFQSSASLFSTENHAEAERVFDSLKRMWA